MRRWSSPPMRTRRGYSTASCYGLQGLFLDPAQLDGRFRLSFGVGRFLDPDTVSPLLLAIVGRVDVITIWITVLDRHRPVRDGPYSFAESGDCRRHRVVRGWAAVDYSGRFDAM